MCRGGRRRRQSNGWSLIALIVILTVALSVLTGLSVAMAENLHLGVVRSNEAKALYLADAGVMDAIASYQPGDTPGNDWFELGCFGSDPACDNTPSLNFGPREVFVRQMTNPQRDVLLVDMSSQGASQSPRVRPLRMGRQRWSYFDRWELRRVASNQPLAIDAMAVRWTGASAGERVMTVWVDGLSKFFTSNPNNGLQSGQQLDLQPDTPLNDNQWIGGSSNLITFNANLSNRTDLVIVLTFTMADAAGCIEDPILPAMPVAPATGDLPTLREIQLRENCQRTAVWVDGDKQNNWGLFTIRTAGEVRTDPFMGRRHLRAEYRAHASVGTQRDPYQIISWREE